MREVIHAIITLLPDDALSPALEILKHIDKFYNGQASERSMQITVINMDMREVPNLPFQSEDNFK